MKRAGVGKPSLVSKFIEEPGSVDLEDGEDLESVVKVLTITTYNGKSCGALIPYNADCARQLQLVWIP